MIHESDPVAHATYLGRVRYWDAVLGELLSRVSWIACDSESDSRPSRGDRRRVSLFSAPTARPGCRRADSERCRVRAVGDPDETTALLREWFPDGRADEHNLVLFSTSGVHGSYLTLEDARRSLESGAERELVTVLLRSSRTASRARRTASESSTPWTTSGLGGRRWSCTTAVARPRSIWSC